MNTLKILRSRPTLFFRLSGIRLHDFEVLAKETYPLWLKSEHKRLSRTGRKRAIGPAQKGSMHDKRIFDESRLKKPPEMMVLGDLGYLGTGFELPIKKPKNKELSQEDKAYNRWHCCLRVGVEHAIWRMKKFKIFADIHRNNGLQRMLEPWQTSI